LQTPTLANATTTTESKLRFMIALDTPNRIGT
jgi:hypothetical protein